MSYNPDELKEMSAKFQAFENEYLGLPVIGKGFDYMMTEFRPANQQLMSAKFIIMDVSEDKPGIGGESLSITLPK